MNPHPNQTIRSLQQKMQEKTLSSRELVSDYLDRIDRIDAGPSGLHSVLERNPDILAEAEASDRLRARGILLGPLHGIPLLVKDNIDTADRLHTSAGSLALARHRAAKDAFVVRKLRESGALILGKAGMSEFAHFMARGMPNGFSSRGGFIYHPADRAADPSGSSTGSAVAVAAGLCAGALGTETNGSILSPAYQCGAVGLKPTAGLLSTEGIIPLSFTLDTPGPIASCVCDAALLLGVMTGSGPSDFPSNENQAGTPAEKARLQRVRVGLWNMENALPAQAQAVSLLESAGAECLPLSAPEVPKLHGTIIRYEFKRCLNRYLVQTGEPGLPKSLREIIAFNERHAKKALPYGQDLFLLADEASGTLEEPDYQQAIAGRNAFIDRLARYFADNYLDAVLSPQISPAASLAGFPALTLPVASDETGMPICIFLMAGRLKEDILLRIAHAVERGLPV